MVIYFTTTLHEDTVSALTDVTIWNGTMSTMPLLTAYIVTSILTADDTGMLTLLINEFLFATRF